DHGETDAMVMAKAAAAREAGLTPIICVGETLEQRQSGAARGVVEAQLASSVPEGGGEIVIAYEPVWAIGTGLTPKPEEIAEMHGHIRRLLLARFSSAGEGTPILYGGSLKPGNAREIL